MRVWNELHVLVSNHAFVLGNFFDSRPELRDERRKVNLTSHDKSAVNAIV